MDDDISQVFGLKKIDETGNHFIEEISQNAFISKKLKNVFRTLNYTKHIYILGVSVFFTSLGGIPIDMPSLSVGLKLLQYLQELVSTK